MKKITFFQGVITAFILSFSGSVLFAVLTPILSSDWALRVVVTLIAFGYLLYLLSSSHSKSGKVTTAILWILVIGATSYIEPPLLIYVLIHIGLIWLVRSLYRYKSTLTALTDLGLNGCSLILAVWAIAQTSSLFLSLWCFFLVQALFVAIPSKLSLRSFKTRTVTSPPENTDGAAFQRAYRSAQAALRRFP